MTAHQTQSKPASVFAIAGGVALGLLAVLVLLFVIYSAMTANDGFECAKENVERANAGLPARDCG